MCPVTKLACLSEAEKLLHVANIEHFLFFPGRSHDDAELGKAVRRLYGQ